VFLFSFSCGGLGRRGRSGGGNERREPVMRSSAMGSTMSGGREGGREGVRGG